MGETMITVGKRFSFDSNHWGVFVPGGIDIGQCAWGVQRSKKVFGEVRNIIRPERWLEVKGEKLAPMERSLGLVWGYGKYLCLGTNIAWVKLNNAFFEVCNLHFPLRVPCVFGDEVAN